MPPHRDICVGRRRGFSRVRCDNLSSLLRFAFRVRYLIVLLYAMPDFAHLLPVATAAAAEARRGHDAEDIR